MERYFVYDPENGLAFYSCQRDAIIAAHRVKQFYNDGGELSDDVERIFVGEVTHRLEAVLHDGEDGNEFYEYEMRRADQWTTPG